MSFSLVLLLTSCVTLNHSLSLVLNGDTTFTTTNGYQGINLDSLHALSLHGRTMQMSKPSVAGTAQGFADHDTQSSVPPSRQ